MSERGENRLKPSEPESSGGIDDAQESQSERSPVSEESVWSVEELYGDQVGSGHCARPISVIRY